MDEPPKTTDELVFRVGVVTFSKQHHKLSDVLDCVTTLVGWVHPYCESPTRSTVTRMKEVILAVGPLTPSGPSHVLVAPSIRGGVVVTFGEDDRTARNATVALLNSGVNLLIFGRTRSGPLEVLELEHAELLTRARDYCRGFHATSTEAS